MDFNTRTTKRLPDRKSISPRLTVPSICRFLVLHRRGANSFYYEQITVTVLRARLGDFKGDLRHRPSAIVRGEDREERLVAEVKWLPEQGLENRLGVTTSGSRWCWYFEVNGKKTVASDE